MRAMTSAIDRVLTLAPITGCDHQEAIRTMLYVSDPNGDVERLALASSQKAGVDPPVRSLGREWQVHMSESGPTFYVTICAAAAGAFWRLAAHRPFERHLWRAPSWATSWRRLQRIFTVENLSGPGSRTLEGRLSGIPPTAPRTTPS